MTTSSLRPRVWLVTGATGLLGAATLRRLLDADPSLRAVALVRDPARWAGVRAALGAAADRVSLEAGDLLLPGLGLDAAARARVARAADAVLHCAADTSFSRPLDEARRINRDGTARLLDLAADLPRVGRWVQVSTAFVAGRRTGRVLERDGAGDAGWVNGYEQSKAEAEALVRSARGDWLVVRPSTVVCDDPGGVVTQHNAVHRALRLYYRGLAAMMPAEPESTLDVVPADFVCDAIAALAARGDVVRETVHLCAGAGAMPLGELLDVTCACWARDERWRRRGIARPALTDPETYRLFERAVEDTGDARLRQIVRSLAHFIPQLALPKRFDTTRAGALLGRGAPAVADYWPRLVEHLVRTSWAGPAREAA